MSLDTKLELLALMAVGSLLAMYVHDPEFFVNIFKGTGALIEWYFNKLTETTVVQ